MPTSRSEPRAEVLEMLAEGNKWVGRSSLAVYELMLDHEEGHDDFWQVLPEELDGVLLMLCMNIQEIGALRDAAAEARRTVEREDNGAPMTTSTGEARGGRPEYLTSLPGPGEVPAGRVVVHNQVLRPARRLGTRGFRAWLATPNPQLEPCGCGWAPELGEHYRVKAPVADAA